MAKPDNRLQLMEYFGAKQKNTVWSWCGMNKEKPLESFELPEITSQRSVLNGLEVVAQKLSSGEILPAEATAICRVLEQYRKHYETTELTERLDMLEQTLKGRNA